MSCHVENYSLVKGPEGSSILRERMKMEVLCGRLIGGPGWTSETIRWFFGGAEFYGVPCSATEKNGDPRGRIIHDYGFFPRGSYSINAAHSSTTVRYPAVKERVEILQDVHWYIKADLVHGFRQFGAHPKDWRYQVYCNGPEEHYIDLACPFGKTNSTLEFCPPVSLFARSVAARYTCIVKDSSPILGSYVDDIFGGLRDEHPYQRSLDFREYMCQTGISLTISFNMKVHKTPLPATKQVILGYLYDAQTRRIRTAEKKRSLGLNYELLGSFFSYLF